MFTLSSRLSLLLLCLSISLSAHADKTDVVYLHNGDRITGEIKSLFRGRLEFSTDHMGTVFIEWEDIREIVSDTGHAVELTNGQRFYGPLDKPENADMLMVKTEQGTVGVGTLDVIAMYPVEASFWERLDINFSLGLSWDKASSVGKYNVGVAAEYRTPETISNAELSTEVTTQEGRDDTTRANFDVGHLVFRGNKRFIQYFGTLENNDELGIDVRAAVGAAYGWAPIRSNRNWFGLAGGLDVNHEVPVDGDDETNLEAVGSLVYQYYKYANPERKFGVNLLVFPSITDFGRWRANFNMDYDIEFVDDFFWKMDMFATYDSDPISRDASNSDYGVVSSVAYKF